MENKKEKSLQKKSFIMDINILEAPFFLFSQLKKATRVEDLEKNNNISNNVRIILNQLPKEAKKSEVKYFKWCDSKGLEREMLALSIMNLPRKFNMDVWYALIGLYIKKISPVSYDDKHKIFDLKNDFLFFTCYELAKFMKISTGGKSISKIKEAIRELKSAQYFSFANGTIYDKSKNKYLNSKERGLSLILDYSFDSEKRIKSKKVTEQNWVQFNALIIDNIRHEYIKYLNNETYFTLPSGITRGLYSYLEANKYQKGGKEHRYIKRSFEVLKNKIPIDFQYKSNLKNKLKNPLNNLIKIGFLSDFFYGDEKKINGVKDDCVYFIFNGVKEDIVQLLTYKQLEVAVDKENDKETKFIMKIPENLFNFLVNKDFDKKVAQQLIKIYSKWDIIKYIIWLQEKEFNNKKSVRNFAGMLRFALESGTVHLERTHPHIIQFIEEQKIKQENNEMNKTKLLKQMYEKYIKNEILKFKKEDEIGYKILLETVLDNLNVLSLKRLKKFSLFKDKVTEDEKEKWENQKNEWIEFKEKKEKSKLFKIQFEKSIIMLRKLKFFEDFVRDYTIKNQK